MVIPLYFVANSSGTLAPLTSFPSTAKKKKNMNDPCVREKREKKDKRITVRLALIYKIIKVFESS